MERTRASDPSPGDGRTFGPYVLLERVGEGVSSVVFRARREGLERDVALKVSRPDLDLEAALEVLNREAALAGLLQGPHSITVHEVGVHGRHAFLAMDLIEGTTFERYLMELPEGARKEPVRVVRALLPALRALGRGHRAGVIHRDVKPSNLLVDRGESAHLTDFGIAMRLGEGEPTPERASEGTPAFMSPEQAWGEPHKLGPASDVYSVGLLLYTAFAGRPPCDDPGFYMMLRKEMGVDPDPLTWHWPEAPSALVHIIDKATRIQPLERFANADQLADELERWARSAEESVG